MASFYVIPFEYDGEFSGEVLPHILPSSLSIDINNYKSRLTQDWGKVQFQAPNIIQILIWSFETEDVRMLKGPYRIQNDYQTLVMDDSDGSFVLWHRSIIPYEFRLFLTGENTSKAVELKSETKLEDLEQVFA